MTKLPHLFPALAGAALLGTAAAVQGQTILFQETFSNYEPGEAPKNLANGGVWTTASSGVGSVQVVQDTANLFGYGTGHQYLSIESAYSVSLIGYFDNPVAVATVSFDFIGRYNNPPDTTRWVNINTRVDGASAHVTSPRFSNGEIRGVGTGQFANNIPLRLDTVVNNSGSSISYTGPDGISRDLANAHASVWLYNYTTDAWSLVSGQYTFGRQAGADAVGALLNNVQLQIDSGTTAAPNQPRSMDIGNITVFDGAIVGAAIPEPSTYALLFGFGVLGMALIVRRRRK